MSEVPDIVEQLREAEKLGKLDSSSQNSHEELERPEELPEEPFEDVPDETVGSVDNDFLAVNRGISDYREVDEKLLDSERVLRNVFDAITDGISVLDKELNIVRVNQFMKDMYSESMPLVGKKCYHIYQHRESPCPWCPSLLAMESGEVQTEIVPYPSKEKPEGWLNLSSFPLKDTNGNISGIIEYVRDVSERKKVEEELKETREHFQTLFNAMVDPVVIIDSKGKFLEITDKVEEITGFKREELLGKNFLKTKIVTGKSKRTLLKSLIKRMAGAKLVPYEIEVLTKDGEKIPHEVNAAKINYMGKSADMVIFRDITDRKRAEEELKEAHELLKMVNSELERKVKERTEKIERLLQQKDEFINQLGHDLKTPLTPLVALTPLLRKHLDGKPEIIKIVDTLVTSTNHMKNMVDKTLQLASLNSSQIEFEFEQTNLLTEIKNAVENNQFLFNENNINVLNMVDEEIIVTADKRQLYEVFTNLFTNAIKYSQENKGSIVIDAEKGKDDEVIISVKDDGIGMTSEQQKFVFDEFYKLDSSRHDLDSSGLGLAICRRIVEHHGGRIWVESPGSGKGCAFYFTLNAWREKIMDKKILLVDDDPDICLTMKIFFDDAGFDLQVVKNGSECLEELEKGFHGVVLMDVMMPGMNGWDVVREMVDKGYMDGNVVAMFSVAAPSEEDMDGLGDYVAGFISKPFDTEELIEIVNGYFDKLQKS